jgi:ABC-type lipoprotein release transport system permease subunit
MDTRMAWRNIWRHPRRTILTISAIAFATGLLVFTVSMQIGAFETMINSTAKINMGHLQVQAVDYFEKRDMRLVVENPAAVGEIFDGTPGIEAYTYRAGAFSMVASGERTVGALVVGIDPEREARVSTLSKTLREGEYLSADDYSGALIGNLMAEKLRVGLGDELTVMGQGRDGSVAATLLTVKGIYRSGLAAFDRSSVHISLSNFQEVYSMRGAVHEVVAISETIRDIPEMKEHIRAGITDIDSKAPLAVLDWKELMPGLYDAIMLNIVSRMIFYLILVTVVASSISSTFLMAVFERTKEFGVMMAVGTTPRRLTKILLVESINMTLVGIAAGIVLGTVVTAYFQAYGIDFSGAGEIVDQFGIPARIYPRLSLISLSAGPMLVFVITSLAALYPALKIRRRRTVDALSYA